MAKAAYHSLSLADVDSWVKASETVIFQEFKSPPVEIQEGWTADDIFFVHFLATQQNLLCTAQPVFTTILIY